jgi:hypothetical protein
VALTLTFDPANKIVSEPGAFHRYTGEELAHFSEASQRYLWADPLFNTIMLKPLQLDPNWLGTVLLHDSIVRFEEMYFSVADTTALRVIEKPWGSNDDPWIHHSPIWPGSGFPLAPAPEPFGPPGAPPLFSGVTEPPGLDSIVIDPPVPPAEPAPHITIHPHDIYEPSAAVPPAATPPTPVRIGGYEDLKTVTVSPFRTEENQAMFFRWIHPSSQQPMSGRTVYVFSIGQYDLHIRDVVLQAYEDISPHGDRTAGRKVLTYPLWTLSNDTEKRDPTISYTQPGGVFNTRWLLWLPFRRNKVLLLSDVGRACFLTTRPDNQIKRNADNTDWVNVRSDSIRVKCLSPFIGSFQIQRVKYTSSGKLNAPVTVLNYTPANTPLVTRYNDADRGTSLTVSQSSPASYSVPKKPDDDCLTDANVPSSLVSRHGVTFTLTSSTDRRSTPFLYGFDFQAPFITIDATTTPLTVDDNASGSKIIDGKFSLGKKPGEGKGSIEIQDFTPYPLGPVYNRSQIPIELKDGATTLFKGYTETLERAPMRGPTSGPWRVTVPILDGWKLVSRTTLTDRWDWTGVGHITAVLETAKLAGVDITNAETPPINTPTLDRKWNTRMQATQATWAQSGAVASPWVTGPQEKCSSFIQRICQVFSGWDVGFRGDGTFFYLPRDYFTSVSMTFYRSRAEATAAAAPTNRIVRAPVNFKTEEPEANVIMVRSGKEKDGSLVNSPLYIDWASIKNKNAVNYLGHWRAEVVELKGGFNCAQLNFIARRIWDQTRRRRVTVEWETDYQPTLKVGHVVTLQDYGNYRITDVDVSVVRTNWRPAKYAGELVEKGYGT